jgi:hypothetical protein
MPLLPFMNNTKHKDSIFRALLSLASTYPKNTLKNSHAIYEYDTLKKENL